jgi:hypothetical protein
MLIFLAFYRILLYLFMNAWLKRNNGPDEIVKIIADVKSKNAFLSYELSLAYEEYYLGNILFDKDGYWIYDGKILTIKEQEQIAKFIMNNMEVLLNT